MRQVTTSTVPNSGFGAVKLTVSDPLGSMGSLALYVPDVDQEVEHAMAAGAIIRKPLAMFVSGVATLR